MRGQRAGHIAIRCNVRAAGRPGTGRGISPHQRDSQRMATYTHREHSLDAIVTAERACTTMERR